MATELEVLARRLLELEEEAELVRHQMRVLLSTPVRPATPEKKPGALATVATAFERHFGHFLASRQIEDVESWLAQRVPPERIVEAIEAVCSLPEERRPKATWFAIGALIRDTPGDQPMRWAPDIRPAPRSASLDRLVAIHREASAHEPEPDDRARWEPPQISRGKE